MQSFKWNREACILSTSRLNRQGNRTEDRALALIAMAEPPKERATHANGRRNRHADVNAMDVESARKRVLTRP